MRLGPLALGAIVGVGVCSSAMAQGMSQGLPVIEVKRQTIFGFNADLTYDTNVAHTSAALAQARGIQPKDYMLLPAATFQIVEPIGQEAVFLNGLAGYYLHQKNKRLDRQNLDISGGGVVVTGICRTTAMERLAEQQSDLADLTAAVTKNLLTTTETAIGATCARQTGLNANFTAQHLDVSNSNALQQPSDHRVTSFSGGFGYGNPQLGNLGLTGSTSIQRFPNRLNAVGGVGDAYASRMLGVTYSKTFGSKLNAQLSIGEMQLKRKSAPVGIPLKTSGVNYTANVDYKMSNRLEFLLTGSRAFLPSNRPGKLFDLATTTELVGHYSLGTKFVVSLGGILEQVDSNKDTTASKIITPTTSRKKTGYGSIAYHQSDKITVTLDLRHENRTTDVPSFDYSDDRATISLATTF